MTACPHEGAREDPRKVSRIRCAECRSDLGVTMRLSPGPARTYDAAAGPRLLFKAADVRCAPEEVESWGRLPESRAAKGDPRAAAAVRRAAAVAAKKALRGEPRDAGPAHPCRRYPEDAFGMGQLDAALARAATAATDDEAPRLDRAAPAPASWRSKLLACFGFA